MVDDLSSTPSERVPEISPKRDFALHSMSTCELAAHCLMEIDHYRRSEHSTDEYALELLHRALIRGEQGAWDWVCQCFSGLVLGWLHRHPNRAAATRLESEENYVAQAFARFWQATSLTKRVEFSTLAAALQCLQACLNGAILDTLRAYSQPGEMLSPEHAEAGEPHAECTSDSSEVWDMLRTMIPDQHELRLAYLFFHCGLKPGEIVRFCSQEFRDIQEIYRLRRSIMGSLLRNADQLRWRLG